MKSERRCLMPLAAVFVSEPDKIMAKPVWSFGGGLQQGNGKGWQDEAFMGRVYNGEG